MAKANAAVQLENRYQRLVRVEQILPTLATKDDLRREIDRAIEPLATKEELQRAIAPLATRTELFEVRDELRRHMDVIREALQSDIQLIAEHVARIATKVYGR
jgi:hypothetical protein